MFIAYLQSSDEILEIADKKRQSPNPEDTNKYKVGQFFSTIQALVTDIEHCQRLLPLQLDQVVFPLQIDPVPLDLPVLITDFLNIRIIVPNTHVV